MSIRSQIERLSLQQRRQLSYAFDNGMSQFIRLPDTNRFVGVHLVPKRVPHLQIEETRGAWSVGRITSGD